MKEFWQKLTARLGPRQQWRRYRVAPRANPVVFRYDLLRRIQSDLQRSSQSVSRLTTGQTTL
jgi:hypothetical protein